MNTNNPRTFGWDAGTPPSLKRVAIEALIRDIEAKNAAKRVEDWQKLRPFSGYEIMFLVWAVIIGTAVALLEISGWLPQILPTALGGGPL